MCARCREHPRQNICPSRTKCSSLSCSQSEGRKEERLRQCVRGGDAESTGGVRTKFNNKLLYKLLKSPLKVAAVKQSERH